MGRYKAKMNFWNTSENAKVPSFPNMTSVLFRNSGDTDAYINGTYKIPAGQESPGINSGNPETLFDDNDLRISFDTVAPGTAPLVQAIIIETFDKNAGGGKKDDLNCKRF
ncbi:MAG: hypothetical protein ABIQ88_02405 [Chitinophagaceae bacterium]